MSSFERGWIPTDDTFAARLALVRQHAGFGNIKNAASACQIAAESWRAWEKGTHLPRDPRAVSRKIADATGCDYYWLLKGLTPPQRHSPRPTPTEPSNASRVLTPL